MATWTFQGQDTGAALDTIGATDKLGLYGTNFDDPITTGSYQDSTHVENSAHAHQCTVDHIHNVKYVSANNADIDGGGSEALSNLLQGEATLKITFSHASSVVTTSTTFWADNGSAEATGPTDVTFQCAEQGDSAWTNADGSGSALSVDDDTTATDHYYYIAVSCSPDTVGAKSTAFRMQMALTYS